MTVLMKGWKVIASPNKTLHLNGFVYGHPKFKDSTEVLTSEVQAYNAQAGTCKTKFTEYKLEGFDLYSIDFEVKF